MRVRGSANKNTLLAATLHVSVTDYLHSVSMHNPTSSGCGSTHGVSGLLLCGLGGIKINDIGNKVDTRSWYQTDPDMCF